MVRYWSHVASNYCIDFSLISLEDEDLSATNPQKFQRLNKRMMITTDFNSWTSGWRGLRIADMLQKAPLEIIEAISSLDSACLIPYVLQRKVMKSSTWVISWQVEVHLKFTPSAFSSTLVFFHLKELLQSDTEWVKGAGSGKTGSFSSWTWTFTANLIINAITIKEDIAKEEIKFLDPW